MTISEYLRYAELAQAAYASLTIGAINNVGIGALQDDANMAPTQSQVFAKSWDVDAQYDGMVEETYYDEFGDEQTFLNPTGLSVTIFEDKETGKQVVAIRGTNDLNDFVTDAIDIALLGTSKYQAQYKALSDKVRAWIEDGTLHSGFSVTGHSLGGFLAQALTGEFYSDVSETYTYNAPGFTVTAGITNIATELMDIFGIVNGAVPDDKITNIRALEGVSATAGLGQMIGDIQVVSIENQAPSLWANHYMKFLTDSLAVHNLLAQVDPTISVEAATGILKAVNYDSDSSQETVVSTLGKLFVTDFVGFTGSEYDADRDQLYIDIEAIAEALPASASLTIEAFGVTDTDGVFTPFSPTEIENLARTDIAYCYALVNGNPFAVLGADYDTNFNQNGELDIYDPATGEGQLTNMYLADRSEMLANWLYANANDTTDSGSDVHYVDVAKDVSLNELVPLQIFPSKKIVFGSEKPNTLEGTNPFIGSDDIVDRLYGMGGDDTLNGYGGDDYLEGGIGNDTYNGGDGNDTFAVIGTDTDYDTFLGGDGNLDIILGGAGDDTIRVHQFSETNSVEIIDGGAGNDTVAGTDLGDTIDLSKTTLIDIEQVDGGAGDDTLIGTDYLYEGEHLIGGAGNDTLTGGKGDDILEGGTGVDTYIINTGDGHDTIIDTGLNILIIDGEVLNGVFEQIPGTADYKFVSTDSDLTLTFDGAAGKIVFDAENSLTFASQQTADDFANGDFWIHVVDAPIAASTSLLGTVDSNYLLADQSAGSYVEGEAGKDMLIGTTYDDQLIGGDGDDWIYANGGKDQIEGGIGNDFITGVGEKSVVNAGDGDDIVTSATGNFWEFFNPQSSVTKDVLWADISNHLDHGHANGISVSPTGHIKMTYWPGLVVGTYTGDSALGNQWTYELTFFAAPVNGNELELKYYHPTEAPAGIVPYTTVTNHQLSGYDLSKGIIANGEAGNDLLVGNNGGDFLSGGTEDDFLFGNGGNDLLDGGAGVDSIAGGAGDDTILGGEGNDELFGEDGSDVIFGGDGDDQLWGKSHTDTLTELDAGDFLYGEAGDDQLVGAAGDDLLFGGDGIDNLFGGEGNDSLAGDAGDDKLMANEGDDVLVGGEGDDSLWGHDGNDTLEGGVGVDALYGGVGDDTYIFKLGDGIMDASNQIDGLDDQEGNNTLVFEAAVNVDDLQVVSMGGSDIYLKYSANDYVMLYGGLNGHINSIQIGDQQLTLSEIINKTLTTDINVEGDDGDNILSGGTGNDTLIGGLGDDFLSGGAGIDTLDGGEGNDIYQFNLGDSPVYLGPIEAINDSSGVNEITFGDNIALADVTTTFSGDDLLLRFSNSDYFYITQGQQGTVQNFNFANGDRFDWRELLLNTCQTPITVTTTEAGAELYGGANNDVLEATGGSSLFTGGKGNDSLIGAGGNNTYFFGIGDGTDTISDTGGQTDIDGNPTPNKLVFGPGISSADLTLSLGSLRIQVGSDPNDAIHIDNFNPDDVYAQRAIDLFEFADGTALTYEQLLARGFDIEGDSGNNTLLGTNVNDRIDGGAGYDHLVGGEGSDTYLFGRGDGADTIDNTDSDVLSIDTLEFAEDVLPTDLLVQRFGDDLRISISGTSDRVTVLNHFTSTPLDFVRFQDGTVWNSTGIEYQRIQQLTEGADVFIGSDADDIVEGLGGNDELLGGNGNDTLRGGLGNDSLAGGEGVNLLDGGDGDDIYILGGDRSSTENIVIDTVIDASGTDIVQIGEPGSSLDSMQVIFTRTAGELTVHYGASYQHKAAIQGGGIEYFKTDGGATISLSEIDNALNSIANDMGKPVEDVTVEDITSNLEYVFSMYKAWDQSDTSVDNLGFEQIGTTQGDTLVGSGSEDGLAGYKGNDILIGNQGDDILIGNSGDDMYLFQKGWGKDRITEHFPEHLDQPSYFGSWDDTYYGFYTGDSEAMDYLKEDFGGQDTLVFMDDIQLDDLKSFWTSDWEPWGDAGLDDLVVEVGQLGDAVLVADYYDGAIENIRLDAEDRNLSSQELLDRMSTGWADRMRGVDWAENSLDARAGDDALLGGDLGDTLIGGIDSDYLNGGNGDDSFLFNLGDGRDLIKDGEYDLPSVTSTEIKYWNGRGYGLIDYGSDPIGEVPEEGQADAGGNDDIQFGAGIGVQNVGFASFEYGGYDYYGAVTPFERLYVGFGALVEKPTDDFIFELIGSASHYNFSQGSDLDAQSFSSAYENDIYLPDQFVAGHAIEEFRLADGSYLTASAIAQGLEESGAYIADNQAVLAAIEAEGRDAKGYVDQIIQNKWTRISQDIVGTEFDDTIVAGDGDDSITAGMGSDVIDAGFGSDIIAGGAGDDTYIYNRWDGNDIISDSAGIDTLKFGPDIRLEDLVADLNPVSGDLVLGIVDEVEKWTVEAGGGVYEPVLQSLSQRITLTDWNNIDQRIENYVFADGLTLSEQELYSYFFSATQNIAPNVGESVALGSILEDGSLQITAAQLLSNTSDADGDLLSVFGVSVDRGSLVANEDGTWSYQPDADDNGQVNFEFTITDKRNFVSSTAKLDISAVNDQPEVAIPLEDQVASQATAFKYRIPEGSFSDQDTGDTLRFRATLSDGSQLPSWLRLDAVTGVFSGVPINGADSLEIKVTATDSGGLGISDSFMLNIDAASPPAVIEGTDSGETIQGTVGDDILYGYAGNDFLSGGEGNDRVFGGTGDDFVKGYVGSDFLSGGEGNDTYDFGHTLSLDWDVINDHCKDLFQSKADKITADWTRRVEDFSANRSGDDLILTEIGYQHELKLEDWFVDEHARVEYLVTWDGPEGVPFNANDGQWVQTPIANFVSEGDWNQAADPLNVRVRSVVGSDDLLLPLTIEVEQFDPNESIESIYVQGLPAGFSLSKGQDLDSGRWSVDVADLEGLNLIPSSDWTGTIDLEVEATSLDQFGRKATTARFFEVAVERSATAPSLIVDEWLQAKPGETISLTIDVQLIDPDETLTPVTISELPQGVSFSAGTANTDGRWNVMVGDLLGLTMTVPESVRDRFTLDISVGSVEGTGETAYSQYNLNVDIDDSIRGTDGDDVLIGTSYDDSYITGGEGNDTLIGGGGDDNLYGDEGDDIYVYNLGDGFDYIEEDPSGIDTIKFGPGITPNDLSGYYYYDTQWDYGYYDIYTSDGGGIGVGDWTSIEFFEFDDGTIYTYRQLLASLGLVENSAPTVTSSTDLGSILEDGSLLITNADLLASTTDPDGDFLSAVNLTVDSGAVSDNGDGSWTYLAAADDNGTVTFSYSVTDGIDPVAATASLELTADNDAPVVADAVALGALQEDGSLLIGTADLLANSSDVDGDTLSVTNLTADNGTVIDNVDGTWTYQPDADFNGLVNFSYSVNDSIESVTASAILDITAVNDAPVVSIPLVGQVATQDSAFSFQVPTDSFSDPDTGESLSYSATQDDGSTLPSWLDFDATEGVFSGTPGVSDVGALDIRVSATDTGGLVAADSFLLVIEKALQLPVVGTLNDDFLFGTGGSELIDGLDGDDYLFGRAGNDQLKGGVGDDYLRGDSGDDLLFGGAGGDRIYGKGGDDNLTGGPGNDSLYGNSGNDVYLFSLGAGIDTLYDSSGTDSIEFGTDVVKDGIVFLKSGTTMKIGYGVDDEITLENYADSTIGNRIENITLATGEYLTDSDINQLIQDMSAYAATEGISLNSIDDIRQNEELSIMIANSWNAA